MSKRINIGITDKGPIRISGDDIRLRVFGKDVDVAPGDSVFLCRCGQSANAPFCDGSHRKGFDPQPPTGARRDVRVWEGRTIKTYFNPNTCMHVFDCKPLKELRERELEGDDDAAAEIARVVQACPSGALSFEAQDIEAPEAEGADVEVMEGGEIRVRCEFDINADRNERQDPTRATLCRCGQSQNKPWCDGRHRKVEGFR